MSAGVLALVALTGAAFAESPAQTDPPFHFLRQDDDFSYLANKPDPDLWERMKYIPLGSSMFGPAYMTLGGEVRERWEGYQNINYGLGKVAPGSGYLLERLETVADLHASDFLRGFVKFGDDRIFSHRGASSTTDTDRAELFERFVDVNLPSPFGDQPRARYGRQEVSLGYQRLVALREGPNIHRDFDGLRATEIIGEASVDFLQLQPTNDSPNAWDDTTNRNQRLSGLYVTTPVTGPLKSDLYYLAYDNNAIKMRTTLAGSEKADTVGARLFGKEGGFDWNVEASWQTGTFRTVAKTYDVQAYLLAGLAGYTFADLPWRPRLGFSANDASGDSGAGKTIGTFNPMFPRLPYFAETPILIPANVRDVRPLVSFAPVRNVDVYLGYDMLWRASTADGLYGAGFVELPKTNTAKGDRVGSEFSIDMRWQYNRFLQLGAIFAQFQSGPAITTAGGKNMTYGVLFARLKF